MKNTNEMTTAEMVAEYNKLTGKSIKKFSSRAAGEKQLVAARKVVPSDAAPAPAAAPVSTPASTPKAAHKEKPVWPFGNGKVAAKPVAKPTTKQANISKSNLSRSSAIASSWLVKKTAEARSERNQVRVVGQRGKKVINDTFRSTLNAFQELGLPTSNHIKFRMELKAAGKAEFDGLKFSIVK